MGIHFGDYGSPPLQRTDRAIMPACPFIPHDPCIISSSTWTLRTSWPNSIYSSLVEGAIPAEGLSAKYSGCFKFTPCSRKALERSSMVNTRRLSLGCLLLLSLIGAATLALQC